MKLTFKDLKQQKFQLDAEPADKISDLKKKIFEHKDSSKDWDPTLQKLIYSGKILTDEKTVEECGVQEKGFIVCMLTKPKVSAPSSSASTPAKAPSTPAPASKSTAPIAPPPAPVSASTGAPSAVPATPTPAGSGTPPVPAAFNDPSALALGSQRDQAIQGMLEMGFERAQIDRAMRAAFNNPDRAVEYLMTGIPEHLLREQAAPRPAAPPAAAPAGAPGAASPQAQQQQSGEPEDINLFEAAARAAAGNRPGGGAAAAAATGAAAGGLGGMGLEAITGQQGQGLDFLRNNAQFQQLRQFVQESPQMLEPILQQVGQGNPGLAQLISSNPDAFLQLLSEGADGGDGGEEDDNPFEAGISVTQAEADAIDRLAALGFSRQAAIRAFIVCERNEELAANYLFDNPEDEEMQEGGA